MDAPTTAHPQYPDPSPADGLPPRGWFSFARRLLLAACDLCAGGTILYLIVRAATGERIWQVALLFNVLPWLLLLNLAPFVITILWGRRVRAVLSAIPLVVFLALYGGLLLPSLPIPAACASGSGGCQTLTVMTYNIGPAGYPDPGAVADALRSSGADIVALQEATPRYVAPFREQLGDLYPYQAQYGDGVYGLALLSRYPFEASGLFGLNSQARYLAASVDVNGQAVEIIVAHPKPPSVEGLVYHNQPGTVEDFHALASMTTQGNPAILLGDFNAVQGTDLYRILVDAGLHDAFRASGWGLGLTFPNQTNQGKPFPPFMRIDFIWHTGDFEATRAWIGPDVGADHLPVLAELLWAR